ncbi:MAG: ferredoxin--NADP reductase [Planctomycetes bacterium]|nr:ferredoxin--NADP reductase [Planctomycetota bacterium]
MTPEEIAQLRENFYNAEIASLKLVNEDLMVVRIRPDFRVPPHKAGQYTTIGLGHWEPRHPGAQEEPPKPGDDRKLIRRAYSLSSSVTDEKGELLDLPNMDWVEFYIVLVREAEKAPPALTPRLFMLKEGDRLFLGEKFTGHFTLDPVRPGDTVVFLATGTGEAPHNYMVWDLLRRRHEGRILSACCVRYHRDLGYAALHQDLMQRHANYTYLSLTTREKETVNQKVYIQDLITSGQLEERLGLALDPGRTHVFLCGNPKMIGVASVDRATGQTTYPQPPGVVEILEKRGFRCDQPAAKMKGNIHFEEYW